MAGPHVIGSHLRIGAAVHGYLPRLSAEHPPRRSPDPPKHVRDRLRRRLSAPGRPLRLNFHDSTPAAIRIVSAENVECAMRALWPIPIIVVFTSNECAAQSVTMDLDRLSKVAYCLGVDTEFKKEMSRWPDECKAEIDPTEEIRRSREIACTSQRNGAAELKRKIDLYNLYIIIRIDVTAAFLTSMTSKSDGAADVGRCFTAVGMLGSATGACPVSDAAFCYEGI